MADLRRQLAEAQAQAAELAGADAKLKRQAQTVAELAAAKSKLLTTESRLAKLQDRHAALQQQYQAAQKTAAEWEAAGARRQVRAALQGAAPGLAWPGLAWPLLSDQGALAAQRSQLGCQPSPLLITRTHTSAFAHWLCSRPQEETEVLLRETQERLSAAEVQVRAARGGARHRRRPPPGAACGPHSHSAGLRSLPALAIPPTLPAFPQPTSNQPSHFPWSAAPSQAAKATELRAKLAEAKDATSSEKQLRLALEHHLSNIEGQLAQAEAARKAAEAQLAVARREAQERERERAAAVAAARAAQPELPGLAPKPTLPAALQAFAAKLVGSDPEPSAPAPATPRDGAASDGEDGVGEAAAVSGAPAGATAAVRGAVAKPLSRRARKGGKGGKLRALPDEE